MKWILALLVMLMVDHSAYAAVIFDTFTEPGYVGFSSPDGGVASFISVEQDVSITGISILNQMLEPGFLKFVIFDAHSHDLLYVSAEQAHDVEASGAWKLSPDLSFELRGGHAYQIGYMTSAEVNDFSDDVPESYNGFTSGGPIACLSNFDNPTFSHNCFLAGDNAVRLHAIPEPSSLVLLGLGCLGLASLRKGDRR